MLEQIFDAANWELSFTYNNTEYLELSIGLLLQDIITNFDNFLNGQNAPIYFLFSGHDSTIGPLLAILGLFDGLWPPYASHIEFELWQDSNENYGVILKYNGDILTLPCCTSSLCPYDTFRQFAIQLIPTNFAKQCQTSN